MGNINYCGMVGDEKIMLTFEEISYFIKKDAASKEKRLSKKGLDYYNGDHDIKQYRLFYYDADGIIREDTTRSNVKIPHAFFTELVDQATQYILSSKDIIKSNNAELQKELDSYFNKNENFISELSEVLTYVQAEGTSYIYAYKNKDNKISFGFADAMNVIEVNTKDTEDGNEYIIYVYDDVIEKGKVKMKRIQVWDNKQIYYYIMSSEGKIYIDESEKLNPRPHIIYRKENDDNIYYDTFGYIPFFRIDNNREKRSSLRAIKELIDDYDLMASSLSNNLIDFDMPIHIVKGFEGEDLNELQQNLKTKKLIGMESTDTGAGIDIKTVDVPFEARKTKLDLDEKNIYRLGMGLNTSSLKDTSATTNIAIKAAYSLLELKCKKLEIRLQQLLRKLINVAIEEINAENNTGYQVNDVYFEFVHEIMSNAKENAEIEKIEAETIQTKITTLLNLQEKIDNNTLMMLICNLLDIDYEDIKDKIPQDDAEELIYNAQSILNNISVEDDNYE